MRTNSLCGEKTPRPARKAERKRAKTPSSKSGKDLKTTLERVRVLQTFFNVKTVSRCTIRRILKKYGIVSRKAAKKFNLNKKQRLIRNSWCSRILKKPLGFYPASIFHRKWEKVWEFFEKKKKNLKFPKKPKRIEKFYQITLS